MPIILNGTTGVTYPDSTLQSTGVSSPATVAQGGTNLATLTANNVILGNGTSAPTFVAPGTSTNVLTSNGTTWTSAAAPAGGLGGVTIYTSGTNTFTIPTGKTVIKVTMCGGGAGGAYTQFSGNGGGGGAGTAIKWLTGLTPGNTLTAIVGAAGAGGNSTGTAGGTSSIASGTQIITTVSATGGSFSVSQVGGAGGSATNGDINMTGGAGGLWAAGCCSFYNYGGGGTLGGVPTGGNIYGTMKGANMFGVEGKGQGGTAKDSGAGFPGIAGIVIIEY